MGGEIVVRHGFGGADGGLSSTDRPDWFAKLTQQQRSIALMMQQGMRPARMARLLGLTPGRGVMIVEDEITAIQAELIRLRVVDESWLEDMADDDEPGGRIAVAHGAKTWTLADS